jgi:hypothetical protein
MPSLKYASNPDYVEHERLLLQLHEIIRAGGVDSDAAESVREQMEPSWWRLTQEEQDRVGDLSADLYQMGGEEVFQVVNDPVEVARLAGELAAAFTEERWEDVLRLLRRRPAEAPDAVVAALRARAYEALGHPEPARRFREYAVHQGHRSVEPSEVAQSIYGPAAGRSGTDAGALVLRMLLQAPVSEHAETVEV